MKKSYTVAKRISAVVLSLIMCLSAFFINASASPLTVTDPEQKLQYLYTFNDAVNAIKEDKPSFSYAKQAGMNRSDEAYYYEIGSKTAADLSDSAYNYLSVIVDAFFNPDRGLVKNFINVLTENRTDITTKEIIKGSDTTYLLPKYGENYISALTSDDVYTLKVEEVKNALDPSKNTTIMRYIFPEADLEAAETSSLRKVFDLPSGSIDPVIISGGKLTDSEGPLSEVKFDDFTYDDAYVQAQFNAEGELTHYTQSISYTFSLSFYDIMRVFGAYTNIDLMAIALAIANPILENTGGTAVDARDVLKDSVMYIRYDIRMELTDFDWEPRYFGDVDNDGDVDAYDARSVLRNSVAMEEFETDEALIYGDVDFDGYLKATDARNILRMSVGLDKRFCEVPDGETIKIVITLPEQPADPENPEDPENPDDPDDPDDPEKPQITEGITEFINTIFDVVNGIKGGADSGEGIAGLIQKIKDIVAAGQDVDFDDIGNGDVFIPDEE